MSHVVESKGYETGLAVYIFFLLCYLKTLIVDPVGARTLNLPQGSPIRKRANRSAIKH